MSGVALYQIVGGTEMFVSGASTTVSAVISAVSGDTVPEVQIVSSGGVATATSVTDGGAQQVVAAGTATGTVVENAGFATVLAGGSVTALQVLGGGVFTDAGTASSTVVSSGGTQQLASGGLALATVITDIGTEYVFYGGTASGTQIDSGGTEVVWGGGTAIGTTVSSGAVQIVSAGSASGTTVESGGLVEVLDGASAAGLHVASGGVVIVAPGTLVTGLSSAPGAQVISTGVVVVSGAAVIGGPSSVLAGNTIGNGYSEFVLPGGTAIGTVLEFAALEQVYSGGTATPIMSGGTLVDAPPIPDLPPTTGSNILPDGNFAVSGISSAVWTQPTGNPAFLSSTLGGPAPVYPGTEVEQPAVSGTTPLPGVVSGALQLTLDTFNPTGAGSSFQGTEVETRDSFTVTSGGSFIVTSGGTTISTGSGGLAFTAVAEFPASVPPGIVAGMFLYNFSGTTKLHDEIDFEARSDFAGSQANEIQVDLYNNAPLGLGSPALVGIPNLNLQTYQTYTIEWLPNQVVWLINGTPVYASSNVPHDAMQFDLDIWAYDDAGSFPPSATSPGTPYNFDVQSVSVTPIPAGPVPVVSDFSGAGKSDALMTDSTGALVLDEISGGEEGYTQIGAIGPEWQFEGDGPIAGDGKDQFLLWYGSNDNPIYGSIVLGEDDDGTASYTKVGSIGPEWQFEGVGPLAGGSDSNVLLWYGTNDSPIYGALVMGADTNGSMTYTDIGGLGPEWQFEGVGSYLNDGSTDFLIWDTNSASPIYGSLVVGEDVNGSAQYAAVGGLGPTSWEFEGSGDLLNDGKESFLIWDGNSSDPSFGALVVGEINNGTVDYTQVGAVGSVWQFLGTGDYDGKSAAEFLMRNSTSGALVLGTIDNGTASYAQVGSVSPTAWNFHTANIATLM